MSYSPESEGGTEAGQWPPRNRGDCPVHINTAHANSGPPSADRRAESSPFAEPGADRAPDREANVMPKLLSKLEKFLSTGSTAKWE
jgi:hypothetical protein